MLIFEYNSIILLTFCDANYNFTYVNIGIPDRCSDSGVFKSCELGTTILNNSMVFPKSSAVRATSGNIPNFIVADEAFPLHTSITRPYLADRGKQQLPLDIKIFNYR